MATHLEYDRSTGATTVAAAFASQVKDRTFIITGVSANGLGGATAKALATQSPKLLVLTGRQEERVTPVIADIHSQHPNVTCRFLELDLSSQASVRKAAAEVNSYSEDIDVLINNAGVAHMPERTLSEDGIEVAFATNHIGHFLLTKLITPKLIAAAKKSSRPGLGRVVNLSSVVQSYAPVRFSDINLDNPREVIPEEERADDDKVKAWGLSNGNYNPMIAYSQSKTANVLFTVGLNQRLKSHGIQSLAVHPGTIRTEALRNTSAEFRSSIDKMLEGKWKTTDQGAATSLVAALDPAINVENPNVYLSDCNFAEAKSWATDADLAEKLWFLSDRLTEKQA